MSLSEFFHFGVGNIPIIISVPHGGTLNANLPRRKEGILGIDKRTIQLARSLINELELKSQEAFISIKSPSFIISKISRSQLDLNRAKSKAFLTENSKAPQFYDFYHLKLADFIQLNLEMFNYSLLLDIHGFEKEKRPAGYRDVEIVLGTRNLSSLYNYPVPKKDWDKNIRGKIINNFLKRDIAIAPGRARRREYLLTGGFITKNYGAHNFPKSQSIQLEFSDRIRIMDNELRKIVIKTLAETLIEFISQKLPNLKD